MHELPFHYNTLVVLFGTCTLGLSSGVLGVFLLLRRRSLIGDAISHGSLPGIALAFLILFALGMRISTFGLLLGAAVTCFIALSSLQYFSSLKILDEGTSIAVILSALFGFGIFLLTIIQKLPTSSASGINRFLYGKPAAMLFSDAIVISIISCITLTLILIFYRPIHACVFDSLFARTLGYKPERVDILLGLSSLLMVLSGLQATGIILIITFLIIPAVSAQLWTKQLPTMLFLSGGFGLCSTFIGTMLSTRFENAPAGPIIVLSSSVIFVFSVLLGKRGGIISTSLELRSQKKKRCIQQLLRVWQTSFENISPDEEFSLDSLSSLSLPHAYVLEKTGWTPTQLYGIAKLLRRNGWIEIVEEYTLTPDGVRAALTTMRRHELYHFLIRNEPSLLHTFSNTNNMQETRARTQLSPEIHSLLQEEHPILFSETVELLMGERYV